MSTFKAPVPILRIFDMAKTKEFYVDFLGFEVQFEHRFGEGFPVYMGVSLGDCVLHLTEHHGGVCPGANIIIPTTGLVAFQESLLAKDYGYAHPGPPVDDGFGSTQMELGDPFGNRLTFSQANVD